MKEKDIVTKYGIFMFVGFWLFFMVMKLLTMNTQYNLRVLNGLVHMPLIYLAIKEFKEKSDEQEFTYFSGVMIGIKASFIGVLSFALFQMVFLYLDDGMLNALQEAAYGGNNVGQYLTPFTASFAIFVEGMIVGMLMSYLAVRIVEMQKN